MANTISRTSDALPINQGSFNTRLGVFGGESFGFANDVLQLATKSFYQDRTQANAFGVAKGMIDPIPRAIFNQYALFNYRGMHGGLTGSGPFSNYFDKPNNSLMGGTDAHNVSIAKIIDFFNEFYPKIGYKAQDFLYLKYYRKIPANHLITLRRFPIPVNDNIFDLTVKEKNEDTGEILIGSVDSTQVAGVTAVTYLGETAGNKLDDILKFTYGLNWKKIESELQTISGGGGYTNQPFYNKLGSIGGAVLDTAKGIDPGTKFRKQENTQDVFGQTYANFVIGPVNVINETVIREAGIKFENDIKLIFDYELKSLSYVNPKIAMIDIISNMLTMTTNNAQFFGGGQRYYGDAGYVSSTFGNMGMLRNGNFSGYMGSLVKDVKSGFTGVFGDTNGQFTSSSTLEGLIKSGKTLLGNMLGGFLKENFGSIGGTEATAALISAQPTGNWHLTVGNPLNPIVMMGNMYCDNAVMTLGNGLGYDDFPVEVKFEIDIKHGKPRDKGDIENMFNAGRGRIYTGAADANDILNLRGEDIATYGSFKSGKTNLQRTQSSAIQAADLKSNSISNIQSSNTKTSKNFDVQPEYISNLVAMMVES